MADTFWKSKKVVVTGGDGLALGMRRHPTFGLAILTWNEVVGIRRLWSEIPREEFAEVFAVDGGSRDGTLEFYRQYDIPCVVQEKPGRGEAFRIAFRRTACDYLIMFSPDGNEDCRDISRFIREVQQGGHDMVIGSRFMAGGANEEDARLLPIRKWANLAFTAIANALFNRSGRYVTDTINGYRAVSRAMFNDLQPDADGYAIEYQLTIRALRRGYRIREIPTREGQRLDGRSKGGSVRTGLRFLALLAREVLGR